MEEAPREPRAAEQGAVHVVVEHAEEAQEHEPFEDGGRRAEERRVRPAGHRRAGRGQGRSRKEIPSDAHPPGRRGG